MNNGTENNELIKEEIRHEFQLERMILFSDAVFAIVITLMAIEIRLPEFEHRPSIDELTHAMTHLIPTIVGYIASFVFIGFIWYDHLKLFSVLKNYDKGLVIRNLLLLFSLGFFPFGVTVVASTSNGYMISALIYFLVILFCKSSQLILQHYILVKKPELRLNTDISERILVYKKSRLATIMLVIMFGLVATGFQIIDDPQMKPLAWWVFFPFPIILKYLQKRIK